MSVNDFEITIEKNIPMPRICKYNWYDMEIGDSFVIHKNKRITVVGSARYHGFKVITRKENSEMIRVWFNGSIDKSKNK